MRVSSGADVIPLVLLVVIYSINNVLLARGGKTQGKKRDKRLFDVSFQFYLMSSKGQVIRYSFDIGIVPVYRGDNQHLSTNIGLLLYTTEYFSHSTCKI